MQEKPRAPRRVRVERGIYRNPSTGGLEIQYTDETGRCRWQTVAGDLTRARIERAEAQLGDGRRGHGAGPRRSFRDVGEEWFRAQTHLRPRTALHYATALDRHLYPRIGDRRIGSIDEDAIAKVISELHAEGLAGWTVRGILVPFGRVLGYAARRKLIPSNPMRRLERNERPRVTRREMRILTSCEIHALLQAAKPAYQPILATAIFTGLRQGELLGLRWTDIDFENDVAHVRHQLDRFGHYVEPKTPRAIRTVMLMPSLAKLLDHHRQASAYTAPTDPVFATSTGKPLHYRNVTRRGLAEAMQASGLNRIGEPRLRFHDLRHTFASLLIAQGLNVVFVSRQLGHSAASFTLDVYGGLFDRAEHVRRASDGLEAAFSHMLDHEHRTAGRRVARNGTGR
jgi:integrase